MTKQINVTVTAYEGDVAFPEADSYPEFVAERLAELFDAEVDCSVGPRTNVVVSGFTSQSRAGEIEEDAARLVKAELWDEFCDHGYRAYSP